MATSLLALLDDITTILDDVAVLTKVAAKKSAGVLGDDLALNAQQVTGVSTDRELPVVWAVFKGSARNKLILVPTALLISAFAPWLVTPLLMAGGLFLCYEGVEKLAHKFLHTPDDDVHAAALARSVTDPTVDLVALEKDKIKGAITTDFILSAEIIAITLGSVAASPILTQVIVLVVIAAVMTVGVYGLVAGIVKLDDAGLYLSRRPGAAARKVGAGILWAAPWLMKILSIAGTAAMFLVGGGILTHGIAALHHPIESITASAAAAAGFASGVVHALVPALLNAAFGIVAGAVTLGVVMAVKRMIGKR